MPLTSFVNSLSLLKNNLLVGPFPNMEFPHFSLFDQLKQKARTSQLKKLIFTKLMVFRQQSFGYISDKQPALCMLSQTQTSYSVFSLLIIFYPISRISFLLLWWLVLYFDWMYVTISE